MAVFVSLTDYRNIMLEPRPSSQKDLVAVILEDYPRLAVELRCKLYGQLDRDKSVLTFTLRSRQASQDGSFLRCLYARFCAFKFAFEI